MFRRKPKTTFEQLPQEAQKLILHFNAEWNMERITEGWAILCWENYKDLYHREGGTHLYMLHLMKQMLDGKVSFHKNPHEQIKWFEKTWISYVATKHRLSFKYFAETTQFPHFLLPLMDKWIKELILDQHYHPDWGQLETQEIYSNSLHDSGLQAKLINELRNHPLLYLLWGSMWYGETLYENVWVLLNQFIYHVAPKFQNPEKVATVLEEIITRDLEAVKSGFLEHIDNCY